MLLKISGNCWTILFRRVAVSADYAGKQFSDGVLQQYSASGQDLQTMRSAWENC